MIWETWPTRWEAALQACLTLGGNVKPLIIQPPAAEVDVHAVEQELGIKLPDAFRRVLTQFSAGVQFRWFLPDIDPPDPFREIFSGECFWDLTTLVDLEKNRQGWVDVCFPDANDPYDRVWHNKLPFLHVPNGDLIALDLNRLPAAPVVYLSHDDGEGHDFTIGSDFIDFMDRWTLLGCPGSEDWQMLPFIASPTTGLEPYNTNAYAWREWFGLHL